MARPDNCPPITVLICTLNEAQNLPYVLPKIPGWVDEILLVDGHSNDNTAELAKEICPQVKVVCQPGGGKGDALKYGIEQATGEIIVTLDADGSTNPLEISNFISPLLRGYDFVKGSRFLKRRPRMPLYRQFGNLILSTTANILFGTKYTDVCSGYNAFWKKAFQTMHLSNDGFEMEQEMVVKLKKLGLKAIEVEQYDAGRLSSKSKVSSIKQGFIDLWVIIKERF